MASSFLLSIVGNMDFLERTGLMVPTTISILIQMCISMIIINLSSGQYFPFSQAILV